ncbi:hypothetical protein ACFLZ0_00780 [Patescibacteria group bacterium]
MSLIVFPQEKKQQKLVLIFIVIVLIIFIILYFGFFHSNIVGIPESMVGNEQVNVSVEDIDDVDFLFLQDSRFNELKKYGKWPIESGQTGRENPFLPLVSEEEVFYESSEESVRDLSVEEFLEALSVEELDNSQ